MKNAIVKTDFQFKDQKSVYKGKVRDFYTIEKRERNGTDLKVKNLKFEI